MNKYLRKKDDVSICYKQSCVHASGKNADLIAFGVFAMLLLVGFAAVAKRG